MFLGNYRHSVDAKGRLAIPAKFREQLPTGSVMTVAPDGALRLSSPEEWGAQTESLQLQVDSGQVERDVVRRLFADAHEIEYDGQGRVLIPARLREAAGLAGTAVIAGANNVVEIWSEDRWSEIQARTSDFTHLSDQLAESRQRSSS